MEVANHMYIDILSNGSYISQRHVDESTSGTSIIPEHYFAKEQSQWTESDKEKVTLDEYIKLNIIDSVDLTIFYIIAPNESAKRI